VHVPSSSGARARLSTMCMSLAGMRVTHKLPRMRVTDKPSLTAMWLPSVAVHVYMRTRVWVGVRVVRWCRSDSGVGTECYAKDASAICSPGAPLAPAPLGARPSPISAGLDLALFRP